MQGFTHPPFIIADTCIYLIAASILLHPSLTLQPRLFSLWLRLKTGDFLESLGLQRMM